MPEQDPVPEGHEASPERGWAVEAARAAATKTDAPTAVLEVGEVLALSSWFVVTSAPNPRQVKAVAEEVERAVAAAGGPRPRMVEGLDTLEWVLVDFGDFAVHVFDDDARRVYDLERLWADVPRLDWPSLVEARGGARGN